MQLKIISAGAGSGKTFRLTQEMTGMLTDKSLAVRASGIIATTFTKKAAGELQERVRVKLLETGMVEEANELANALIGTVHSVGVNLLKRFAFEAGVSPEVDIMADEDMQMMFNQSLASILSLEKMERLEYLVTRLGLNKSREYDWRSDVRNITEVARSNGMGKEALEISKVKSWESFKKFLPVPSISEQDSIEALKEVLEQTITTVENNEDNTKTTQNVIVELQQSLNACRSRGYLLWHEWAKIGKAKVGAKSREDFEPLANFVSRHEATFEFQENIASYINLLFDTASEAIEEFTRYKKERGLIDYIDMETLVNDLLDIPTIKQVLSEEIDLLMVDEFQDTSPIQLEIFLKLSKLANHSIWVGDPKQSIYGFRGAAPELMQAIVDWAGGIQPENILGKSWRSREDVVYATNAIFTKAFPEIPRDQVALEPVRKAEGEPEEIGLALVHYFAQLDPDAGRMPGKPWFENAIAQMLKWDLENGIYITPKGSKTPRKAKPGDVAILCRTNFQCQDMAEALHNAGLKAAISRTGLLDTAEAKFILACLKYILNKYDSLSVAEILTLGAGWSTEKIIEHRLEYLNHQQSDERWSEWAADESLLLHLNDLRQQMQEYSGSEILDVLLEELDIRRKVMEWGNPSQRLNNVDVLCQMALEYEEGCNRLHLAASLGGFLLWLDGRKKQGLDFQGSGESEEAVNVLTYHKSKGLEYPVTICHSLEGDLRGDVWGIEIVSDREEVDLDDLLGNRWIRFWVNPYGDQVKGTGLMERLEESDALAKAKEQAKQEEARLLYVGITRARDYLVFPSRTGKSTKWLNRVWNGDDERAALDPTIPETPWEWDGKVLYIRNKVEGFGRDFTGANLEERTFEYISPAAGKKEHIPFYWKGEEAALQGKLKFEEVGSWERPYAWNEHLNFEEKAALFEVLKAVVEARWGGLDLKARRERVEELLLLHRLTGLVEVSAILGYKEEWENEVVKSAGDVMVGMPVKMDHGGRIFKSEIPFCIKESSHITIVLHFAEEEKKPSSYLHQKEGWIYLATRYLKSQMTDCTIDVKVNFPLSAKLHHFSVVDK
ncbi:MAG: UvrD-helicase domain-containing protein [Saprospiraceae bacterium]|nr:UvrD-helicase domain-containing protein [Saprospiraceae bacterium]